MVDLDTEVFSKRYRFERIVIKKTSALKLFALTNFCVINSVDNTLLPCYSRPPTQRPSFFKETL